MERNRDQEIKVIPKYVPMSEKDSDEVARIIARLLVDDARRELRERRKKELLAAQEASTAKGYWEQGPRPKAS